MIGSNSFLDELIRRYGYAWSAEFALGYLCEGVACYGRGLNTLVELKQALSEIEVIKGRLELARHQGMSDSVAIISLKEGIPLSEAAGRTPSVGSSAVPPAAVTQPPPS